MGHKDDLEKNIRESYRLICEYEEIQRLHPDPRERMRAQHLISDQQELIRRYLSEYIPLCQRLGLQTAPDILELIISFSGSEYQEPKKNAKAIRVLFLSADPSDTSRLRLGAEIREIQEQLQKARLRERFELSVRMSARPMDVSQALLDIQPQIVHISGHGDASGAICLENDAGKTQPVTPEALAALFKNFVEKIQCVVLNTCYADTSAQAIAKHIDYVIGTSRTISDEAAIAFSIGFYQALGAGCTIEEAYRLGRAQVGMKGFPEHLTYVLRKIVA